MYVLVLIVGFILVILQSARAIPLSSSRNPTLALDSVGLQSRNLNIVDTRDVSQKRDSIKDTPKPSASGTTSESYKVITTTIPESSIAISEADKVTNVLLHP